MTFVQFPHGFGAGAGKEVLTQDGNIFPIGGTDTDRPSGLLNPSNPWSFYPMSCPIDASQNFVREIHFDLPENAVLEDPSSHWTTNFNANHKSGSVSSAGCMYGVVGKQDRAGLGHVYDGGYNGKSSQTCFDDSTEEPGESASSPCCDIIVGFAHQSIPTPPQYDYTNKDLDQWSNWPYDNTPYSHGNQVTSTYESRIGVNQFSWSNNRYPFNAATWWESDTEYDSRHTRPWFKWLSFTPQKTEAGTRKLKVSGLKNPFARGYAGIRLKVPTEAEYYMGETYRDSTTLGFKKKYNYNLCDETIDNSINWGMLDDYSLWNGEANTNINSGVYLQGVGAQLPIIKWPLPPFGGTADNPETYSMRGGNWKVDADGNRYIHRVSPAWENNPSEWADKLAGNDGIDRIKVEKNSEGATNVSDITEVTINTATHTQLNGAHYFGTSMWRSNYENVKDGYTAAGGMPNASANELVKVVVNVDNTVSGNYVDSDGDWTTAQFSTDTESWKQIIYDNSASDAVPKLFFFANNYRPVSNPGPLSGQNNTETAGGWPIISTKHIFAGGIGNDASSRDYGVDLEFRIEAGFKVQSYIEYCHIDNTYALGPTSEYFDPIADDRDNGDLLRQHSFYGWSYNWFKTKEDIKNYVETYAKTYAVTTQDDGDKVLGLLSENCPGWDVMANGCPYESDCANPQGIYDSTVANEGNYSEPITDVWDYREVSGGEHTIDTTVSGGALGSSSYLFGGSYTPRQFGLIGYLEPGEKLFAMCRGNTGVHEYGTTEILVTDAYTTGYQRLVALNNPLSTNNGGNLPCLEEVILDPGICQYPLYKTYYNGVEVNGE